jgi:protein-disulfide isomerase
VAQRNRKAKQQPEGPKWLKPFYVVLAVIAAIGMAGIAYAAVRGRAGHTATQPVDMSALTDPSAVYRKAKAEMLGDTAAPVKMVVFVDYMCPHCAEFDTQILPMLKQKYVATGKLQVAVYDFPLGGAFIHSFLAARAAHCAGLQGKYFDYSTLLFSQQQMWASIRTSDAVTKQLLGYGDQIGLNHTAFQGCVQSDRFADVVTANHMLGEDLGVQATPWVIIDGKTVPNAFDVTVLDSMIVQSAGG